MCIRDSLYTNKQSPIYNGLKAAVSLRTVSYTHLDVYKRQIWCEMRNRTRVMHTTRRCRAARKRFCITGSSEMCIIDRGSFSYAWDMEAFMSMTSVGDTLLVTFDFPED